MRSLVALLLTAALATGCSDADPDPVSEGRTPLLSADDAQGTYGVLATDVAVALGDATGVEAVGDGRTVYATGDDGMCEFWSQEYDLPVWFGGPGGPHWADVLATVEASIGDGWTVGEERDLEGGFTGLDATEDESGAVLEVRAKGTSTVRVVAPVEGGCGDDASPSPVMDTP